MATIKIDEYFPEILIGIGLFVFSSLSILFIKSFFKFEWTFLFTISILIAIFPTLIYFAFFKKEDDGSAGGIVGYYLIKLLRKLRR